MVSVDCPMDLENKYMLRVQQIRLCRYNWDDDIPVCGTSPLSNPLYFQKCVSVFDEEWEDHDIEQGFDVCFITGNPGPDDRGNNEIMLAGRI
jgi:hypothetical protein